MEPYIEDLFYHKYRSSVARLRISAHFFPIEAGQMMNKPREERMCPFCFHNQIGDEQHYIFQCTHPKFTPIRIEPFEAILKWIGMHIAISYEST